MNLLGKFMGIGTLQMWSFGVYQPDLGSLTDLLSTKDYEVDKGTFMGYSSSLDVYIFRLVLRFGDHNLSTKEYSGKGSRARLYGEFDDIMGLGFIVYSRKLGPFRFSTYPVVSFGRQRVFLELIGDYSGSLKDLLDGVPPSAYIKGESWAVMGSLTLAISWAWFFFGVDAGYLYPVQDTKWYYWDKELSSGPQASLKGYHMRGFVGVGVLL